MSEDYSPATKSDLLEVVHTERKRFEALLDGLSAPQMTAPRVEADWSIKDILAHIAAWERLASDRIHAGQTGEPLKFPVITGDNFVDQFNADVYEQHKDQALDTVVAEFHAAHRDLGAQIEALDEAYLSQRLPFDWAGKLTYQVVISANTHWHYAEHAAAIEKWLDKQA